LPAHRHIGLPPPLPAWELPIDPEKLEASKKMLEFAEKRRLASMAQFEVDGLPPFMRDGPKVIES